MMAAVDTALDEVLQLVVLSEDLDCNREEHLVVVDAAVVFAAAGRSTGRVVVAAAEPSIAAPTAPEPVLPVEPAAVAIEPPAKLLVFCAALHPSELDADVPQLLAVLPDVFFPLLLALVVYVVLQPAVLLYVSFVPLPSVVSEALLLPVALPCAVYVPLRAFVVVRLPFVFCVVQP